jgi:hypothetical protein
VLSVVILFFGAVFLALTNHQEYSNDNTFSIKNLISGNYLARVEKSFNESIPLQDYLHKAESYIKYCFGIGNKTDIIDIESKKNMDDPYSIDDEEQYDALTESAADGDEVSDDSAAETEPPQDEEEEEEVSTKKVKAIEIKTETTTTTTDSEEQTSTTTNNRAPGATTTTTVPPQTSQTTRGTESAATETQQPTETTTTEATTLEPPVTEGENNENE